MSAAASAPRRETWPRIGHHAWKIQMGCTVAWMVVILTPAKPSPTPAREKELT